ncbi:hypothetical protein LXA47_21580 [Massilia sp. P8910]|uniref:hypothetical protein n=1 Tax=Massilia antarctica TaxID=2765360 RepID=UPI0011AF58C1|nr:MULTISPECIES: hypothetical protein [Massilia]MCE3606176.1 hypothetical protein [Massilia antarctica]MCY0913131.1 hypothetical protein [Massilia sp. H27-R4]
MARRASNSVGFASATSGHGCALQTTAINYLYSITISLLARKKKPRNRAYDTKPVVYIHIPYLPLTSNIPICFYLGLDWQKGIDVERQSTSRFKRSEEVQPTETALSGTRLVVPCTGRTPQSEARPPQGSLLKLMHPPKDGVNTNIL